MSKATGALAFSTAVNWYNIVQMLDYCKKHSSSETYLAVMKSFKRTMISILTILFIFVIIFVAGIIHFDKAINSKVTTNNISYSLEKTGHVGNGVVWYIDNIKYEIDPSQFGYDINHYDKGTDFYIYLDENHNVVDVKPVDKSITASDKMALWLVGSLFSICFILIAFVLWTRYSKSELNPTREYAAYVNWFRNKSADEKWYYGSL